MIHYLWGNNDLTYSRFLIRNHGGQEEGTQHLSSVCLMISTANPEIISRHFSEWENKTKQPLEIFFEYIHIDSLKQSLQITNLRFFSIAPIIYKKKTPKN